MVNNNHNCGTNPSFPEQVIANPANCPCDGISIISSEKGGTNVGGIQGNFKVCQIRSILPSSTSTSILPVAEVALISIPPASNPPTKPKKFFTSI